MSQHTIRRTLAAIAASAMVIAGLTACSSGDTPDKDLNGGVTFAAGCVPVPAVVSPEKLNMFTKLSELFNDSLEAKQASKALDGQCISVAPIAVSSGVIAKQLGIGWPTEGEEAIDVMRPVIVSPASSVWIDQVAATGGAELVQDSKSFARTPVVYAMPEPMARKLGWPKQDLSYAKMRELCLDPAGWAKFGGSAATWGPFKMAKTVPDESTTGLFTIIMQSYGAVNKSEKLTVDDVNKSKQFSKDIESCVMHYGSTTGNVLKSAYEADAKIGNGLGYFSWVAVEETSVINYNLGNPSSGSDVELSEDRRPNVKLVAMYLTDGSMISDNPVVVLGKSADWVTDQQRIAAKAFAAFVQTPVAQNELGNFGFRPVDPKAKPGGLLTAENGVDVSQPKVSLEMVSPEVSLRAKSQWNEIRKPSSVELLLDGSGSMNDRIKDSNTSMVTAAINSINESLGHFRPGDEVGITVFSSRFDGDVSIIRQVSPLAGDLGNLQHELKGVIADGGTPLYDALWRSYDEMKARAETGRINGIILLSDGEDSGSRHSLDELKLHIKGSGETTDQKPVRVFPIVYGNGAPPEVLKQIADLTGGQVFNASNTTQINKAIKDAMNNF